jgi:hypothetical protein
MLLKSLDFDVFICYDCDAGQCVLRLNFTADASKWYSKISGKTICLRKARCLCSIRLLCSVFPISHTI